MNQLVEPFCPDERVSMERFNLRWEALNQNAQPRLSAAPQIDTLPDDACLIVLSPDSNALAQKIDAVTMLGAAAQKIDDWDLITRGGRFFADAQALHAPIALRTMGEAVSDGAGWILLRVETENKAHFSRIHTAQGGWGAWTALDTREFLVTLSPDGWSGSPAVQEVALETSIDGEVLSVSLPVGTDHFAHIMQQCAFSLLKCAEVTAAGALLVTCWEDAPTVSLPILVTVG